MILEKILNQNSCTIIWSYVVQLEKYKQLKKISSHEILNQQYEFHYIRTTPIAASLGFLFRGFKQWNVSLKVLINTGSFTWIPTVVLFSFALNEPLAMLLDSCIWGMKLYFSLNYNPFSSQMHWDLYVTYGGENCIERKSRWSVPFN